MTLNINLTPELEKLVRGKVASGMYNSASEVVREALRLMEERGIKLQRLRQDIQDGMDSGDWEPWNQKEFLQRMHKEHAKRNKKRGEPMRK